VKIYKAVAALENGYWREQKLKEIKELIAQCSGLFLEATTTVPFAVQTDSIRISFSFNNRLGADATLQKVQVDAFDSSFNNKLEKNRNFNFAKSFLVAASKPVTQPYWLAKKMEEGYFNVTDQQKIGQADIDPSYQANVLVRMYNEDLSFPVNVKYKYTDPVKGEIYQPLVVIPPITFREFDPVYIKGEKDKLVSISFLANKNLTLPKPTAVQNGKDTLSKLIGGYDVQKGQQYAETFRDDQLEPKIYKINVAPDTKDAGYISKTIAYDHIPSITYFKNALLNVEKIDLKIYNKKIGYIVGAGDKVPEALEQMGYEVTLLTDKELAKNNLSQFDAIITGVRAYNTNEWMRNYYDKLMKYVNDGGNLIVQYNNTQFRGGQPKIGPYNFNVVNKRITDENAEVVFLKPDHPVLNFPNKITQQDFKGWIQERSIYHASNYDKANYETIFSMHDPGEGNDEGSLVIAKYGKGYFTYTGIVFFRELPAGVPGAYRLLANIIALNKKKAF